MPKQNTIPALGKSIQVLQAIASGKQNYSIAELARHLQVPQTTCYRIVQTLIAADWLRPRAAGVGYELSYGMMPLVQPFLNHRVLIDTARRPMEEMVRSCGLAAKLVIRQNDEGVTVFRVESHRPMALSGRVGIRFTLAYGSSGACLMSDLNEIQVKQILDVSPADSWKYQSREDVTARIQQSRQDGLCLDMGNFHPHIHTMSAPLHEASGRIAAAITLLGLPGDFDVLQLPSHKLAIRRCVQACERLIRRDGINMNPAIKE